ncbi:hypothetical protein LTR56_011969 [Elasticomyces elasticus]|nr:hypothetical protein LTR22_018067 [Elasticomyces elasticus]KAK3640173.1 hypothetical protein LTR56_011969 [Elasticomyces elasticus]KAK4913312.1 hypothetical protein LTR49_018385 [Elasticomyces elasticus]KAK5749034.1 hypothetical protein LTS12_020932 [Elasticomyces elasticus]
MDPSVSYNMTSEGPFTAFTGQKYLLVSFGTAAAKLEREDAEVKLFNITQDVALQPSATYEFSARAQVKSGSTAASCKFQLCVAGTCANPVDLGTNWTRTQVTYAPVQESSTFDIVLSCRGDGYVGLDGLAVERVVSRVQTVYMPSNQTYSQTAAPRVTETVYSNITQERTVVSTQSGQTIATVRYSNISVTVLATATTSLPGDTLTTVLPRETTTNRETLTLPQMNGTHTSREYFTATVSLSSGTETQTAMYTTAIYSNATYTMPASTIICRQTDD